MVFQTEIFQPQTKPEFVWNLEKLMHDGAYIL